MLCIQALHKTWPGVATESLLPSRRSNAPITDRKQLLLPITNSYVHFMLIMSISFEQIVPDPPWRCVWSVCRILHPSTDSIWAVVYGNCIHDLTLWRCVCLALKYVWILLRLIYEVPISPMSCICVPSYSILITKSFQNILFVWGDILIVNICLL